MMNSHYDTVTTSPGGGDSCATVSVVLEVLRKMSRTDQPFEHSVVFLLNGAEEVGLLAAHAFITQHKWAKDIKAFINMDSAGNGGREILFRVGPQHPWLLNVSGTFLRGFLTSILGFFQYYRKTSSHPYSTVMAEEMFRADLVPSGTDYQYFVQFGGIPGYDFAQISNGYVYHTQYDVQETIPMESLQNTGDNILALTLALANADELRGNQTDSLEEGEAVFFDFLGWFLINYNNTVEIIVNVVVILLGAAGIWLAMVRITTPYENKRKIVLEFFLSFAVQLLSVVLGGVLAFVLNLVYFNIGRSMSWYAQPWLIFGLYFCPFVFGMCFSCLFIQKLRKNLALSLEHRVQLLLHAHCLLLVLLLTFFTIVRLRSGYMVMLTVLFHSIPVLINAATKLQDRGHQWLWAHLVGNGLVNFSYFATLSITAFVCFIPVAEKYFGGDNPEFVVALLSILMSFLMLGFLVRIEIILNFQKLLSSCSIQVPLISLFRSPERIVGAIFGIMVLTWILMATPVGFPYRDETALQRKFIGVSSKCLTTNFNYSVVLFAV
jgi:Peptidase family M28